MGVHPVSWDAESTPDATFAGLSPTPGLVPAGASQAGDLKSNSGKAITEVEFSISGQGGVTFSPSHVFVGYGADVDGSNISTMTVVGYENIRAEGLQGIKDEPPVLPPAGPGVLQAISHTPGRVTSFSCSIRVPSCQAAGFRAVVQDNDTVGIVVAVSYKRGS